MEVKDGDRLRRRSRPMMYKGVPIVDGDDYMAIQAAIAAAITARPRQTTNNIIMSPAAQITKQRPMLTPLYKANYIRRADGRESKCIEESMGQNLDPSTATAVHPRPTTNNIIMPLRKLTIRFKPNSILRADFERESKSREESIGENLNPSSAAATAIGSNVEVIRHSLLNMDLGKSSEEAAI